MGMGLFSTLFGTSSRIEVSPSQHAVIVHFEYDEAADLQPLFDLEDQLRAAIADAKAGEYDGHEVAVEGASDARLYIYGPNADRLFEVIRPILAGCPFMGGARVQLLYGEPEDGVPERNILLGERVAGIG
jgi:hypothetical protein